MDAIAKKRQVALGERLNAISREFVSLQRKVQLELGVRDWQDVPADVRNRAVGDYKRAIGTASAQGQGSAVVGVRAVGGYK